MLLYICYPKYGSCCPMWKSNINFLLILFIIFFSLTVSTASASVVTLSWDAPTTNADGTPLTDLAGYKIYYGTSSGAYSTAIKVGNITKYMAYNLENGVVYYFAVTAYDMSGKESKFSNEVSGVATSVVECNLVPDTVVVPRGGTLGFQITITNNTNKSATVLSATKATKPDGTKTRYLIGPLSISFDPYESKSGHRSHTIPANAPLGTYTYQDYVGNYGVGIYDECEFNFTVTQ